MQTNDEETKPQEPPDTLPATPPLFVGYRKIIVGLIFHATSSGLVYVKTIPASVYGDITIALVLALLGSNVLAKFANVMGNKRYGTKPPR